MVWKYEHHEFVTSIDSLENEFNIADHRENSISKSWQLLLMIPSLNLENHFIILKKLSPPPSITKFWSKGACLDVLIDRIEHEYLFYGSNLVTYGCFLIPTLINIIYDLKEIVQFEYQS